MEPNRALSLNPPLETSALALEPLRGEHAEVLFEPLRDPRVYTWIAEPPPRSLERLREHWASLENRLSPDGLEAWLTWAVRLRQGGPYIGKIDAAVDQDNVAINVGYVFFPDFWGQGHATAAVGVVTEHLLSMGVRPLKALVTRGNRASARVLEKNGFVHTRVLPEHETLRGVPHDDLEYVRG